MVTQFGEDLFYVMQTVPDGRFKLTVGLKLKKMLEKIVKDDTVRGLVINPREKELFFLQKNLIAQVLKLCEGSALVSSESLPRKLSEQNPERNSFCMNVKLPLNRSRLAVAGEIVSRLENAENFCIEFKEAFDDILFIQTEREGEAYRTEICFDMSEFGQAPLVLQSNVMTQTEVMDIIEIICVKMIPSDDISCIMNWKSKF